MDLFVLLTGTIFVIIIAKSIMNIAQPKPEAISFIHFTSACNSIFSIILTPDVIVQVKRNMISVDFFFIALNSSFDSVLLLSDR